MRLRMSVVIRRMSFTTCGIALRGVYGIEQSQIETSRGLYRRFNDQI